MAYETIVTFSMGTDDKGETSVRAIYGGTHRGGVTEGFLRYSGGLSVEKAWGLSAFLRRHVNRAFDLTPQDPLES